MNRIETLFVRDLPVVFDYSKLKGRIIEKFGTIDNLSNHIPMSRSSLSGKLNNKVEFSQEDILILSDRLDIDHKEIPTYFFSVKV